MYSIAIVVLLTALCLVLDDVEWSLEGKGWRNELGTDSADRNDDFSSDSVNNRSN